MSPLNSKAWKVCSQGLFLGALSTGTYSIKKTINQGKEDLFFTILGESLKTENRTLRDVFKAYSNSDTDVEFLKDQDAKEWKLVSWINAPKIHEIAEEITFDRNYNGIRLSEDHFKKIKHENMNIDYSDLLKDHCKKYLDIKIIDLFPSIGNDLVTDHLKELYDVIVPWCTKPTEKYEKVQKYFKEGKTLGFLLSEKSKFDNNNVRYNRTWFLNRIFPSLTHYKNSTYYMSTPYSLTQIGENLDWCNKNLRNEKENEDEFLNTCMKQKMHEKTPSTRDLKVKKWKLRPAWIKNEKFSSLKINLE